MPISSPTAVRRDVSPRPSVSFGWPPALVQMGVDAGATHLFILYFGTRAEITPPVALAAYAGAGMAGSDPWKTGLSAFQLGIAGFIIPFMFVYAKELLFIGALGHILWALVTAVLGVTCLAAAVQCCLLVKATWIEVIVLYAVAFLLIKPGLMTDIIGFGLFAPVMARQWLSHKRRSARVLENEPQPT